MHVQCAPIKGWNGKYTKHRQRSRFESGWGDTLDLLRRELAHLRASSVTLELDIDSNSIRNDGWPRAQAKVPPPVRLSFSSKHGPMALATDRFDHWSDNVRAIALGLEALRKIDRYGIADSAQQYTGWSALPAAGETSGRAPLVVLAQAAGVTNEHAAEMDQHRLVRLAKAKSHPDAGGSDDLFNEVTRAAEMVR